MIKTKQSKIVVTVQQPTRDKKSTYDKYFALPSKVVLKYSAFYNEYYLSLRGHMFYEQELQSILNKIKELNKND